MKDFALLVAATLVTSGCTTLRPVEAPVNEVRQQIRAGTLLSPGDRIRVTTDGGARQKLRIAEIESDGTLVGKDIEVRVDEIAALEKRERSWVKTGVLAGLIGLTLLTDCEGVSCDEPGAGPFCCS